MQNTKVIRLPLKWRKPLNELELATRRPYVPDPYLSGRIRDIIQRVTAAGERIRREREQAEREQALRERRERLSALPAPTSNVIAFQGNPTPQAKRRRRRRAKVIALKRNVGATFPWRTR